MFSKIISITVLLILSLSVFGQDTSSEKQEKKEYTPEQKAKIKQAEELAEKFVRRWHETLDLKILDDEFFVKNPKYLEHRFGSNDTEDGHVHNGEGFKAWAVEVYFSMNESFHLERELRLIYGAKDEGLECLCPEELKQLREILSAQEEHFQNSIGENGIDDLTDTQIKFVADKLGEFYAKYVTIHRALLSLRFSTADEYQERLKRKYPINDETKSEINKCYIPIDLGDKVECYHVSRGVFDFNIIEENGQMKVVWIDDGW
jgi:hypothetical protein